MFREDMDTILVAGSPVIKRIDADIANRLSKLRIRTLFYYTKQVLWEDEPKFLKFKGSRSVLRNVVGLARIVMKYRPRHMEMYIGNPYYMLPVYSMFAKISGLPLVVWCRGSEILDFDKRSRYRKWVTKFVFRLADWLILKEAEMLKYRGRLNNRNIWFLHNGVPVHGDCTLERRGKIVLFLNAPQAMRHPEVIIQAIPMVVRRVPDARFQFVGFRNKYEYDRLTRLIAQKSVEKHVELYPYNERVRRFYDSASVFVLPAERIFLNHSLLEAMERCVPPIVSDLDSNMEGIIVNNRNGIVLPLEVEKWADAIVELLTNEDKRRRLGRAARQTVERSFSLDEKIEKMVEFYRRKVWKGVGGGR